MIKRVVISGCSGGGKSTLLAALAVQGFEVVQEPGRRVIAEERASGGDALPWLNTRAFVDRLVAMSTNDLNTDSDGWIFFDRGFVDAMSALSQITGDPLPDCLYNGHHYHPRVFLTPPWLEIFENDADRRHGFSQAVEEFERLELVYPALGYEVITVPKTSVEQRVTFVLRQLGILPRD